MNLEGKQTNKQKHITCKSNKGESEFVELVVARRFCRLSQQGQGQGCACASVHRCASLTVVSNPRNGAEVFWVARRIEARACASRVAWSGN